MDFTLHPCASPDAPGWLTLRMALWPETPEREHLEEMSGFAAQPDRYLQLLAIDLDGNAIGLLEASIRSEYVNGTASLPVGFLEGLYVSPEVRQQGVARALVDAAIDWARSHACGEFASDTQLDNTLSQRVHLALGFVETERLVYFVRPTDPGVN